MSNRPVITLDEVFAGIAVPERVRSFCDAPCAKVVFGPGKLAELGAWAKSLGRRAMVVTDEGILAAGYVERAVDSLETAGLSVSVFSDVHENPTTEAVAEAVAHARDFQADLLIGLGGGSSMDAAKGCNFILTNGGEMRDYRGKDKATLAMLPLIAVPTTAGTGSECQSFALIADAVTHQKMACGDNKAAARVALLDPELTLSQPPAVTAVTAIDAMSHAVESRVTTARSAISIAYSETAFALTRLGLVEISEDPLSLLGRARIQVGAALAGTAIENSMLGAAHSCANPLTARFGIIHGQAVGIMLPAVVRYNATHDKSVRQAYAKLIHDEPLDSWILERLQDFELETRLSPFGVTPESLQTMAAEATTQWTAQFNPVPLDEGQFLALFKEVL